MPLKILEQVELQPFCTLAVPAVAGYYCLVVSEQDVRDALDFARAKQLPLLVLGGGSNIVLRADFSGLVMHMALRGIETQKLEGSTSDVFVTAAAGESWQALVDFSLEQGLWGLENLNLIPGTVGAAPIQNIGAYGVELEQVFYDLQALRVSDSTLMSFTHAACEFSYRDSFFKRAKGQYIILSVRLRLSTQGAPKLTYPGLADGFTADQRHALSSAQLAKRVAELRRSKLPDPEVTPNAGSFFHNPIVSADQESAIRAKYPDLVSYAQPDGGFKLAAAWLIDKAGLKGMRVDGVGVHAQQALVLVNPGKRSGEQVLRFAATIAHQVEAMFGVRLVIEPQIYP